MGVKTMNKVIPSLLALVILQGPLNAQDDRGFKLGIKAAPNMGWIRSDTKELEGNGAAIGFSFGLLGDFRLGSDNYALATGLFLNLLNADQTSKAYQFTSTDDQNNSVTLDIPSWEFNRRYQFVEVPVLVKLKTNEIGYMTYFGQLGFGSAFNVSARSDTYRFDSTKGEFTREEGDRVSEETNLFRASLVVGAGLEYKFAGNTALVVGINYNNGFTDAFSGKARLFDAGLKDKVETHGKLHYLELLLGVYF